MNNKIMKVWIQGENTESVDVDLPTTVEEIRKARESLGLKENDTIYISDYEYLIENLSYEDGEQMDLVNQFTNVFQLDYKLGNIIYSKDPDAAIALLIADMMRENDLNDIDKINYYIERYTPIQLDPDIFNYTKNEKEFYWYILDVSNPMLSDTIASNDGEPYFDVTTFVQDMVLGDATVTSTGYLVWHY